MRATPLILPLATLGFAAAVALGGAPAQTTPPPPPMGHPAMAHAGMEHAPVVGARRAAFRLSLASFVALNAAIKRGDDPKTLVLPASAIASWGKAIPAMFPPGSVTPESEALPNIWSDRAGFEAAAADMSAAAAKLADLAKAGDTAALPPQWDALKASCAACHDKYRKPEEKH